MLGAKGWVFWAVLRLLTANSVITCEAQCPSDFNGKNTEYSFLYRYLTGTGAHNFAESVTIGFLGAYGESQVALGALPLAIDEVNRDPTLLEGRRLKFVAADIGTYLDGGGAQSSLGALAIRTMTEMRDNGTIAFIGPDGTCSTEALVAAAWNLPMIAYKCTDKLVSDKRMYNTFARTLPPSTMISKSVLGLLRTFDWNTFVIVTGKSPAWAQQITQAIQDLAEENGMVVTDIYEFTDYLPKKIKQMEDIVSQTFQRTRVYVFVGEHIALVDFVICLQSKGLLEDGQYVVVSVDDEIYDPKNKSNIVHRTYLDPWLEHKENSIDGFRSVLKLTPSHPRNPNYTEICEEIKESAFRAPFCVPYHEKISQSISVPIHAAHLYDAVMIYARALTEVFQRGDDPRNGTAVLQRIVNRSYHSIQGYDVRIDRNGDAEGNYSLVALMDDHKALGPLKMSMQPVGYFRYPCNNTKLPEFKYYDENRKIQWLGGSPPLAVPLCGFKGEKCYRDTWRISVTILGFGFLFLVAAVFLFRHYTYEQKLAGLLWKVDIREVTILPITDFAEKTSVVQVCRQSDVRSIVPEVSPKRAYTSIGMYKGTIVAIKTIHKKNIDITRSIRKELKQVREIRHENILSFIGACVDAGSLCILTAYCARGSLEDVLANKDLHLDNVFVSSLVADIIKGMIYLHDSDILSHGNLRSSNCLVDSRWVLQIADFGLHEFKAGQDLPGKRSLELKRSLWRAPELLRNSQSLARGTQKGDVYSFAIVLYEIVGRKGPWGDTNLPPEEIVLKVRMGGMRPDLKGLNAADSVISCLESCWHEDPETRPEFRLVRVKLKEMQAGLKPNIFDNMLAIMEKYAYNLEGLVQERTNQLTEEKKKTDALLNRMLPSVAEALKRGDPVEAENFECVTIYFSDIVGFTELSAASTPLQVVDMLNDLYTCCDSIISSYDVYKVETIGDAYMVVSGLPVRNEDRHAGEIASMALHLLESIRMLTIRHMPGKQLKIRIGIHSGDCVAGVVGLKMPRYCLFGDTVNTASRMESTGEAFKIHISETTYVLLSCLGGYHCHERGKTLIKGKGEMFTYWLLGEDPTKRRARLKILSNSSSSSERLTDPDLVRIETPDLVRSSAKLRQLPDPGELPLSSLLHSLYLQGVPYRQKYSSQDSYEGSSRIKGHRSAPVISFTESSLH